MVYEHKPINEVKAVTEYNVLENQTDFTVGFEFDEDLDNINVFFNGIDVTELGHTVTLMNDLMIHIEPSIPTGVLRIERETDIDRNKYQFTAGALFTPRSIDENFEQIRKSQQEVRDLARYLLVQYGIFRDDVWELVTTALDGLFARLDDRFNEKWEEIASYLNTLLPELFCIMQKELDSKWVEMADYLNTLLPELVCIMYKELDAYVEDKVIPLVEEQIEPIVDAAIKSSVPDAITAWFAENPILPTITSSGSVLPSVHNEGAVGSLTKTWGDIYALRYNLSPTLYWVSSSDNPRIMDTAAGVGVSRFSVSPDTLKYNTSSTYNTTQMVIESKTTDTQGAYYQVTTKQRDIRWGLNTEGAIGLHDITNQRWLWTCTKAAPTNLNTAVNIIPINDAMFTLGSSTYKFSNVFTSRLTLATNTYWGSTGTETKLIDSATPLNGSRLSIGTKNLTYTPQGATGTVQFNAPTGTGDPLDIDVSLKFVNPNRDVSLGLAVNGSLTLTDHTANKALISYSATNMTTAVDILPAAQGSNSIGSLDKPFQQVHTEVLRLGSGLSIITGIGTPLGNVTALIGSMYIDEETGDWYQKKSDPMTALGWVLK